MGSLGANLSAAHIVPALRMEFDDEKEIAADLETLARIAARLAGRDPDEHVEIRLGDVVPFSGAAWRYPDFVSRAVAAYDLLKNGLA